MSDAPSLPTLTPFSDAGWRQLSAQLQATAGLTLPEASAALVTTRLAPRLRRLGRAGFDDYLPLLAGAELHTALDLLTETQAGFFREPAQFDALEAELSRARPQRTRIWSTAASAGDEAYSLAMLLADLQQAGRIGADWLVLGTDISTRRLRSATEAVYAESRLRQVAPDRLRRHGVASGGTGLVQVQAALRERVHFERHDLRTPLHGGLGFDAVWLRQALVYFDAATRRGVLQQVLARLNPRGLLVVGTDEQSLVTVPGLTALGCGVFRKT